MVTLFYAAGFVAIVSTLLAMTRSDVIVAVLYLILSLLATALVFFALDVVFAAMLQVVLYVGLIMTGLLLVLLFTPAASLRMRRQEQLLSGSLLDWLGPMLMALCLLAQMVFVLLNAESLVLSGDQQGAIEALTPVSYMVTLGLALLLLIAALLGARHLSGALREPQR